MRTCTEKQTPAATVSSREAAERAAALTKEPGVLWESERSFSKVERRDGDGEIRQSASDDESVSED